MYNIITLVMYNIDVYIYKCMPYLMIVLLIVYLKGAIPTPVLPLTPSSPPCLGGYLSYNHYLWIT